MCYGGVGVIPDVQRLKQDAPGPSHVSHRTIEGVLIGPRRGVEPADLADELERGVVQLLVGRGMARVSQALDVPTHLYLPFVCSQPDDGMLAAYMAGRRLPASPHKDLTS
jgi:hypothetical protein